MLNNRKPYPFIRAYFYSTTLCLAIFCFYPVLSSAFNQINTVYGYLETISLLPWNAPITAKLDSGTSISSLSAEDIYIHKIESGQEYVAFRLSHPSLTRDYYYDIPLKSFIAIKNKADEKNEAQYTIRPVVELPFYFDGQIYNIDINLINRSHFKTPVLIGRKLLQKLNVTIDPNKQNTITLTC